MTDRMVGSRQGFLPFQTPSRFGRGKTDASTDTKKDLFLNEDTGHHLSDMDEYVRLLQSEHRSSSVSVKSVSKELLPDICMRLLGKSKQVDIDSEIPFRILDVQRRSYNLDEEHPLRYGEVTSTTTLGTKLCFCLLDGDLHVLFDMSGILLLADSFFDDTFVVIDDDHVNTASMEKKKFLNSCSHVLSLLIGLPAFDACSAIDVYQECLMKLASKSMIVAVCAMYFGDDAVRLLSMKLQQGFHVWLEDILDLESDDPEEHDGIQSLISGGKDVLEFLTSVDPIAFRPFLKRLPVI